MLCAELYCTDYCDPCCRLNGGDADDLESKNKSVQKAVFATLYTLTKNKTLDASLRVACLRVVLEFLQVRWLHPVQRVLLLLIHSPELQGCMDFLCLDVLASYLLLASPALAL